MKIEQMMELMLDRLDSLQKDIKTNQEDIKTIQENADANYAKMLAKINASRNDDPEDLKEIMEKMMTINLMEIREEVKSGQAEMRSTVSACRANTRDDLKETMSSQVMTEA
jgi:uncharacterized protein YicC (UPF0701 family)